jgi:hypothetical protein
MSFLFFYCGIPYTEGTKNFYSGLKDDLFKFEIRGISLIVAYYFN